ncbi:hypothetical protein [Lacrimispora sp.]|uniref:hypothetical protein n=1 Tax=Lacrimispora sp. TaxID=2719234 RepID=UPI00345FB029
MDKIIKFMVKLIKNNTSMYRLISVAAFTSCPVGTLYLPCLSEFVKTLGKIPVFHRLFPSFPGI